MNSKESWREEMDGRARAALSVAGRQRYESDAAHGPYSRAELRDKISSAWSVAERQHYEGLYEEMKREWKD